MYRTARINHRRKRHDFYRVWDVRFSDRQDPALADLLLREATLAMMAALGRTCRDRRININVRRILARDYLAYSDAACQAVDFAKKMRPACHKDKKQAPPYCQNDKAGTATTQKTKKAGGVK